MQSSKPATVGTLALALLVGVGALMSHARQSDDSGPASTGAVHNDVGAIGMVDLEKIYDASEFPAQFANSAAQIEADAQTRIQSMAAVSQLSEAELREYGELVGLKNPDAKQKVRMDELRDFNDKRSSHLRDVQQKPDATLTPEDRKLMASSVIQKRQFDRIMALLQADLRQQIGEREESVKRGLIGRLRVEVGKVAKEKKIQHVFDSSAMVTSTNDLTAAVIQRITRKPDK